MPHPTRRWLTFVLTGFGLASRLPAQATGLPVRNGGGTQGISLGADFGAGRIDRAGSDDEVSRTIAATVAVGFGPLGWSGSLSRTRIDPATGPNRTHSVAAMMVEVVTLGGPLVPFRLAWQGGYARQLDGSERPWRATVGLGASATIPAVVVSIKPWLGPRLEYRGRQPSRGTRLKPAVAAGIDVGLLNGLGFRLGYDNRLGWDSATERAAGVSFGVSYQFR